MTRHFTQTMSAEAMKARVDEAETELGRVAVQHARQVTRLAREWAKLAGRCLWHAGAKCREPIVKFDLARCSLVLGVPESRLRDELPLIAGECDVPFEDGAIVMRYEAMEG